MGFGGVSWTGRREMGLRECPAYYTTYVFSLPFPAISFFDVKLSALEPSQSCGSTNVDARGPYSIGTQHSATSVSHSPSAHGHAHRSPPPRRSISAQFIRLLPRGGQHLPCHSLPSLVSSFRRDAADSYATMDTETILYWGGGALAGLFTVVCDIQCYLA